MISDINTLYYMSQKNIGIFCVRNLYPNTKVKYLVEVCYGHLETKYRISNELYSIIYKEVGESNFKLSDISNLIINQRINKLNKIQ